MANSCKLERADGYFACPTGEYCAEWKEDALQWLNQSLCHSTELEGLRWGAILDHLSTIAHYDAIMQQTGSAAWVPQEHREFMLQLVANKMEYLNIWFLERSIKNSDC